MVNLLLLLPILKQGWPIDFDLPLGKEPPVSPKDLYSTAHKPIIGLLVSSADTKEIHKNQLIALLA
jgi:hypothetical protein